ncbi:HAMP domain-containing sensor histidine kinase [Rubinisphaera italica]|uniref:histidine kinase n=1 Tax=Rubinisphaera italica TaxID=2527969 RepID=A0A5C5XKZ2_9PLAN|nr:ATP-binding protein [Rubinisphaera italica]TWT63847.1 Alkaline phosphatase synthesis sensor protein PhoR [Rubinisphaera italica]
MSTSRFFWRIFLTHVALIVLCTVGLSLTVVRGYRQMIEERFQSEVKTIADVLTDNARAVLLDQTAPQPSDEFFRIAAARDNQHHLFNADRILIASSVNESERDQILISNAFDQLNDQRASIEITINSRTRGPYELLLRELRHDGKILGYLQIEASREKIQDQLQNLSGITWAIVFAVCCVGVALSMIVVSRITRPVEELTRASQAIASGQWSQKVPVNTKDELGSLAEAFNEMSREMVSYINELQNQGQQLRANSERLATVLGGMVEGVIAVDSAERILFANKAAFKMIEFEGQRVVGRPYWEVLRNTDVQSVVREVLSGQFQRKREIVLPRNQSRIAFIASRLPGEPCPGVVLVLHDVTELRRLEQIRSEFVSNVGHELKTPLAAIQACTETLLDGAIEDPKHAHHFLAQITEHGDRLHKLIIDLMELAKIESEEDAFHLENIDIGIPIQEAIDEHYPVAHGKQISLITNPTIDELLVKADHDGIRTIINNLIDNALNYTPTGGEIKIGWKASEGNVVIEISDSGIGIEPRHLERIFERFYRVDTARARAAGGTGLGLAIVKHLCNYFSGSISVRSELNQGSTFTLRFPQVEEPNRLSTH